MVRHVKSSAKAFYINSIVRRSAVKSYHKKSSWFRYGAVSAGVLLWLCIGAFAVGTSAFAKQKIDSSIGIAPLDSNECYVPNVSGMGYEEAEDVLSQKHLKVEICDIVFSDSIEKYKILSQSPEAGKIATEEDTIELVISGGTEEVMMPDFSGMTCDEAQKLAGLQHLVIQDEKKEEYHDLVAKGSIITQNIAPKERVAVQSEVLLTVSLGRLSEETALLTVPDLTGITQEQALKRLEKLKDKFKFTYSIGDIKSEYSTKVKKGDIISQSPEAGTKVRTNEPVHLVISRGPEMIQVPQVVNLTKEKAVKKLEKAGFSANVKTEYSSQVSEGRVIRQGKKDGAKAAKGSSIKIVISLGVQPVQNTIRSNNSSVNRGWSAGGNSVSSNGTGSNTESSSGTGGNSGSSNRTGGNTGSSSGTSGNTGSSSSGTSGNSGSSSGTGGNSGGGSSSNSGTSSNSGKNQTHSGGGESSNNRTEGNQQQNTGGTRVVMPDGTVIVVE